MGGVQVLLLVSKRDTYDMILLCTILFMAVLAQGMTVRVTTVDKHDIYHISDIDMPSCSSEASPRPLMAITTTMKEVIQFQPFTTKKSPISREVRMLHSPGKHG